MKENPWAWKIGSIIVAAGVLLTVALKFRQKGSKKKSKKQKDSKENQQRKKK